jgi:hypothetical protein
MTASDGANMIEIVEETSTVADWAAGSATWARTISSALATASSPMSSRSCAPAAGGAGELLPPWP